MIKEIIRLSSSEKMIKEISEKIFSSERISPEEGIILFNKADLSLLAVLADHVRKIKNGNNVYYIRNLHVEPSNICIYKCRFCSYSRSENEGGSWELSVDKMLDDIAKAIEKGISEVHIVGGVHPEKDLAFYENLIRLVRNISDKIHIKAFTAIELEYMFRKSGVTYEEGFEILKNAGLDSIPGGGAEIFDEEIRKKICEKKPDGKTWLAVHETAHHCGIPSNATMLYGHLENYSHRIAHLEKLRQLQDKTKMFNAFIPLKFRNKNNELNKIPEASVTEDLRNYALCRIYLDNFPHIKAYWPMIGRQTTQLSLSFGVDDIDGTIEDSTKIYSMAGVEDQHPSMSEHELLVITSQAGRVAVERDSLYNPVMRK
ncbi:MAG: CofH family radical SAM protein [Bacteroidota bacterium]